MSLKKFKEECMFEQFKDKCFKNARAIKSKMIRICNDIDIDAVYRRIVNYQIEHYGESLTTESRKVF